MNNNFPHPSNPYPFTASGEEQNPGASSAGPNTPSDSQRSQSQAPDSRQSDLIAAERLLIQQAREPPDRNALMQMLSRQQMTAAAVGPDSVLSGAPFNCVSSSSGGIAANPYGSSSQISSHMNNQLGGMNSMENMNNAVGSQTAINNFMSSSFMNNQTSNLDSSNMSNHMNAMNNIQATASFAGGASSSSGFRDSISTSNQLNAMHNLPAATASVAGSTLSCQPGFSMTPQNLPFDLQMSNFMSQSALMNNGPSDMNSMQNGQQLGLQSSLGGGGQNGAPSSSMGSFPFRDAGFNMNPGMPMVGSSSVAAAAIGAPNMGNNCQQSPHRPSQDDPGWEEQYNALQAYRLRYGHCKVPARYKADPKLGRWVMTQRRQFALLMQGYPSALTAERIRRLEAVGFVWSVRPEPVSTWNKKYLELKAYKAAYGNCMVPQRYRANPQLGTWVHTQRRQHKMMSEGKKSSMTREKANALDSIGFSWAAKLATTTTSSASSNYDDGSDRSDASQQGKLR